MADDEGGDGDPESSDAVVTAADTVIAGSWNGTGYAVYGKPGGDPVLFCHPAPGSRVIGQLLAEEAATLGVRLVAPERPGYGQSVIGALVGPFTTTVGVGDVTSQVNSVVVDALELDEYGVVGFSSGCPFALATAASDPDRVTGVALVGASTPPGTPGAVLPTMDLAREQFGIVPGEDRRLSRTRALLGSTLEWFTGGERWSGSRPPGADSRTASRIANTIGTLSDEAVVSLYDDAALVDRTDVAPVLREDLREGLGDMPTGFETERRLLWRDWGIDFGSIEAPVALLHGTEDPVAPVAAGRSLGELVGGHLGKVEGTGHLSTLLSAGETALRHAAPSLSIRDAVAQR